MKTYGQEKGKYYKFTKSRYKRVHENAYRALKKRARQRIRRELKDEGWDVLVGAVSKEYGVPKSMLE